MTRDQQQEPARLSDEQVGHLLNVRLDDVLVWFGMTPEAAPSLLSEVQSSRAELQRLREIERLGKEYMVLDQVAMRTGDDDEWCVACDAQRAFFAALSGETKGGK